MAAPTPQDILLAADTKRKTLPVWLVRDGKAGEDLAELPAEQRQWLQAVSYKAAARRHVLVPGAGGGMAGAVLGIGKADEPRRPYPPETLLGLMPTVLPGGAWHLGAGSANAELAAVAWGLGAYQFRRYKLDEVEPVAALKVPKGVDLDRVTNTVEGVWLGRDLINTPASDMGPQELEEAARALAKRHGAKVTSIVGDDLLKKNFPMIHAVGRASPRAPRLIDLTWGRADAPKRDDRRQGHLLRHRRPRHQAVQRHADDEEGHGRRGGGAGAGAHGDGAEARRAPARADPGGGEQRGRQSRSGRATCS